MKRKCFMLMFASVLLLAGCNASTQTNRVELDQMTATVTIDEVVEGDFVFRLMSEKAEYKEGEEVALYGEIEYLGDADDIDIFHSSSAIIFDFYEQTREYEIGGAVNDIGLTTTLKKGIPYREDYVKSGGYSEEDDPDYVQFVKNFLDRKDFPMGFYEVEAIADFSYEQDGKNTRKQMKANIEFKVTD